MPPSKPPYDMFLCRWDDFGLSGISGHPAWRSNDTAGDGGYASCPFIRHGGNAFWLLSSRCCEGKPSCAFVRQVFRDGCARARSYSLFYSHLFHRRRAKLKIILELLHVMRVQCSLNTVYAGWMRSRGLSPDQMFGGTKISVIPALLQARCFRATTRSTVDRTRNAPRVGAMVKNETKFVCRATPADSFHTMQHLRYVMLLTDRAHGLRLTHRRRRLSQQMLASIWQALRG